MKDNNIFIPEQPLNTAVLFLVFNRLDTTKQVFESIRQVKPMKLYIAADGAREIKEGEIEKVRAVRDYISSNVDWKCDVKTLFREQNLGCKIAITEALDWFFENEEMGIILEDDCLPSQSFFKYQEDLLHHYKDDRRIMCISGNNFIENERTPINSYDFSEIPFIWGWGTWRRAWIHNHKAIANLKKIKSQGIRLCSNKKANKMWLKNIFKSYNKEIDTWDYLWSFTNLINDGLTIIPNRNLVKNVGLGHTDATNTIKINKKNVIENKELNFPIIHPLYIKRNIDNDNILYKRNFGVMPIYEKIINKLFELF